jgi:hypothetical protein
MALRFDLNKPSRFQVTFKTREAATTAEVHFELLSLPLYAVEAIGRHSLFSSIAKTHT